MGIVGRHGGVVAAATVALLLSGCSSLMPGAFGDRSSGLADVANIEYYASDQALAEAKNHFRQGNYGHSATLYKKAAELEPKDAEAFLGLAASYDRLRRFDLADRAYVQAIRILGATPEILNNQGFSYMLRGDYKRARETLLAAQAKDPASPFIQNNLALLAASARKAKAVN